MQVFTRSGRLTVLGVETGNPGLEAEIVPKTPGQFYDVVLRYAGGWQSGPVRTTVVVRTDDPKDPVLKVPFRTLVQ